MWYDKHRWRKTIKTGNWLLIIPVLLLSGCATVGFIDYTSISGNILPHKEYQSDWEQIYPGLEMTYWVQNSPSLAVTALRIDLEHPERHIFVTPGDMPVDGKDKNFSSRTTIRFLEDFDCIAAINATPYYPFRIFQGFSQRAVAVHIGVR